MEIIALQEYTDKYISLYQGEIRNVSDVSLAQKLISDGIIAEHSDSDPSGGGSGGSGGSDIVVVKFMFLWGDGDKDILWDPEQTLRTNDLIEAIQNGKIVMAKISQYTGGMHLFSLIDTYSEGYGIAFKTPALSFANITGFNVLLDNSITLMTT